MGGSNVLPYYLLLLHAQLRECESIMLIVSSLSKPYKPSAQRIDYLFNNAARAKIQTLFKPICARVHVSRTNIPKTSQMVETHKYLSRKTSTPSSRFTGSPKNITHINSYSFLVIHGSFNRQKPSIIPTFTLRNKKPRHM
jgi:hypothetical protein